MRCPFCGYLEDKVLDTRPTDEGSVIRRRRECLKCQKRFTTYEKIENVPLVVIKKDGTRESFDRQKLLNGLIKACQKRPVTMSQLEKMVDDIEAGFQNSFEKEVTSVKIGEMVMQKLKDIDEVAYVRFASVYREFKDIHTFMEEINKIAKQKTSDNSDK